MLKNQVKIKLFKCKECDLKYDNIEWRDKCEKWCKENRSCNLDIIKYSIKN